MNRNAQSTIRWTLQPRRLAVASATMFLLLVSSVSLTACSLLDDDDTPAASPVATAADTEATATPTDPADSDSTTVPVDATAPAESTSPTQPATDGSPQATPATTPASGVGDPPVTTVSVGDLLDDPAAFIDSPVTLNADVDASIADLGFTVRDTDAGDALLVVGAPGLIPVDLEPGSYVRVGGFVRTFNQEEIELAIGSGLDDDAFSPFEGQPVVVANEVRIGLVAVDELLGNVESFVGRRVTVAGPIGEIASPQAFTLQSRDGAGELLIIAPFRAVASGNADGKWVRTTGIVHVFDPASDEFPPELDDLINDDALAAYVGQPVVVLDLLEILSDDTTATTGEITASPDSFVAQPVIVSDFVGQLIAPQIFTLTADGQQLLVIAREGTIPSDLTTGAVVLINGTVDTFSASGSDAIVWQALGIDPSDPAMAGFDGQPAIIADRIDLIANASDS